MLERDLAVYSAAAGRWRDLAEDIDNAAEDLIRGTRDLAQVWPEGPASQAAHGKPVVDLATIRVHRRKILQSMISEYSQAV
ncbi:hypothetical protein [Plantactinospora soyae]|uniref:Uncharacterized protein n=1 Tax=Plantactinospora soyae TaxID=1544732 RepID=A0A927MDP6_9ACTN|nr:hypothetical protein [Plantactinospora soyae]MBE1491765.1 hypothetical protein [Plantactinospora soyae]